MRNSTLAAGTVVHSHCNLDGVRHARTVRHRPVRATASRHRARRERAHRQFRRDQEGALRRELQGEPSFLHRRRRGRRRRQHRRRHDHLQLRRRHPSTRPIIEDGAFIGSNTSLVAPVRVGKDATIGAGSVINKEAPAGELSLCARQADRRFRAGSVRRRNSGTQAAGSTSCARRVSAQLSGSAPDATNRSRR